MSKTVVSALWVSEVKSARVRQSSGTTALCGLPTKTESSPALLAAEITARGCDPGEIRSTDLAGERVHAILTHAPGNSTSIGRLKVQAVSGWLAACPWGTGDIYKIYTENFRGPDPFAPHSRGRQPSWTKLLHQRARPQQM